MTHNTREVEEAVDDYLAVTKAHPGIDKRKQLIGVFHQELQKARQDWLREEIVRLEGMKKNFIGDYEWASNYDEALQTIIDRYQKELDQDNTKGLPDTK